MGTYILQLAGFVKVPGTGTVTIRYRAANVTTPGDLTVELYQGGTLITSWVNTLTTTMTDYTHDLTTEERNAITDWTNLRYAITAGAQQVDVSWCDLQTTAGTLTTVRSPFPIYRPDVTG